MPAPGSELRRLLLEEDGWPGGGTPFPPRVLRVFGFFLSVDLSLATILPISDLLSTGLALSKQTLVSVDVMLVERERILVCIVGHWGWGGSIEASETLPEILRVIPIHGLCRGHCCL